MLDSPRRFIAQRLSKSKHKHKLPSGTPGGAPGPAVVWSCLESVGLSLSPFLVSFLSSVYAMLVYMGYVLDRKGKERRNKE